MNLYRIQFLTAERTVQAGVYTRAANREEAVAFAEAAIADYKARGENVTTYQIRTLEDNTRLTKSGRA